MKKHLTYDDRLTIERGLCNGTSLAEIGRIIGKDRTTISREIRRHRISRPSTGNSCVHRQGCDLPDACPKKCVPKRRFLCRMGCVVCNQECEHYEEEICIRTKRAPYVCNGCLRKRRCFLNRWHYDAKKAQLDYEKTLRESREGISLTEEELGYMDDLLSPLLMKGQSIEIACSSHVDELPVSSRTVYNYVGAGLLTAKNTDLARRVRRKSSRRKSGPVQKVDKACHLGRSYEDFCKFMQEHPDYPVTEGDTVEGKKGGKVLLTLHLRICDLQLAFIRDHNNAASVSAIFQELRDRLEQELFRSIFRVILVDRGSEFTDPLKMEADHYTGEILTNVFYCDPQNSNQKAHCERNHELIRYVIPKGTSMDHLTQADINKMMSHINSYRRKKWNLRSPIEMFDRIYGQQARELLGLQKIDQDSILLKPELLK